MTVTVLWLNILHIPFTRLKRTANSLKMNEYNQISSEQLRKIKWDIDVSPSCITQITISTVKPWCHKLNESEEKFWDKWRLEMKKLTCIKKQWLAFTNPFGIESKIPIFKIWKFHCSQYCSCTVWLFYLFDTWLTSLLPFLTLRRMGNWACSVNSDI